MKRLLSVLLLLSVSMPVAAKKCGTCHQTVKASKRRHKRFNPILGGIINGVIIGTMIAIVNSK